MKTPEDICKSCIANAQFENNFPYASCTSCREQRQLEQERILAIIEKMYPCVRRIPCVACDIREAVKEKKDGKL